MVKNHTAQKPKKLLSISTKTGDKGESGLANGVRLPKDHPVFDALGTVDELNSWLGMAIAQLNQLSGQVPGLDELEKKLQLHATTLLEMQDALFYIGADLAQSPKVSFDRTFLTKLEKKSEKLQESMAKGWTTKFLFPGGTVLAAHLDVARTVCRRAERSVFALHLHEEYPLSLTKGVSEYLNRASDFLYVLRCFVNQVQGFKERPFVSKFKVEVFGG